MTIEGFVYADQAAQDKTAAIIAAGCARLAFVLDWDGVITPNDPTSMGGTNWAVLKRIMTTESLARHEQLFHEFRPLEEQGLLTSDSADRWQRQAMELLIDASIYDIENDARNSNVNLRPGMSQFFETTAAAGIPVFIKSAGERHIIEAVAEQHNFKPAHIFANEFIVEDGRVIGVHEHSLTHSLNKHTFSHKSTDGNEARSTMIVVGDNLHDAHMIDEEPGDTVLRVRVDAGQQAYIARHGSSAWPVYLERSFQEGFDLVGSHEDVTALTDLTRAIIASHL